MEGLDQLSEEKINTLPIEILVKIALETDVKSVIALCKTSKRLNRLCNSEMYWGERMRIDYPDFYIRKDVLPEGFSYKRYYSFLASPNIGNKQGKPIFQEIDESLLYNNYVPRGTYSFIYPLPLFDLNIDGSVEPDIVIKEIEGSDYLFATMKRRKTVQGKEIPAPTEFNYAWRELNLPWSYDTDPRKYNIKEKIKELLQEAREKGYDYIVVGSRYEKFSDIIQGLIDNNYLIMCNTGPGCRRPARIDKEIFNISTDVPSSGSAFVSTTLNEPKPGSKMRNDPPLPAKKKPGIFDFLFSK